jgi:acyl dehydratase
MLDRSKIGQTNGERFIAIEHGQLKLFCQAIGETNPIFWDEVAAKDAGYPNCPIPPTFPVTLDFLAPCKFNLVIDVLKAPLGRLLHGEQSLRYHHQLFAGDRARLLTTIADIYDKKNGALEFIVQETTIHNQKDELCCTMRSTAVLRN